MSNVQFKLNKAGVRELLKSEGVYGECKKVAQSALAKCGDGYAVHDVKYPERSGVAISAPTMRAVNDNKKNNTLLKAVGG